MNRTLARDLKVGQMIIDQEGIDWTVTKIEPAPADRLEITFNNPMLMIHTTIGTFKATDSFERQAGPND